VVASELVQFILEIMYYQQLVSMLIGFNLKSQQTYHSLTIRGSMLLAYVDLLTVLTKFSFVAVSLIQSCATTFC